MIPLGDPPRVPPGAPLGPSGVRVMGLCLVVVVAGLWALTYDEQHLCQEYCFIHYNKNDLISKPSRPLRTQSKDRNNDEEDYDDGIEV